MAATSRRAVVALAASIALLLGSGIAAALTVDAGASPPGGPSSRPRAATSAPPPPPPPVDLSTIVVPGPPGFDQIPDAKLIVGGAATGDRLAAERSDQVGARTVFKATGLQGGFVRAWQRPSTSELVTVRLYQFGTAEGAKTYANGVIAKMAAPPAPTFVVPATTDTVGIDSQVPQGTNRLAFVVERKDRVVAAIAATVVPPPETGFVAPLARSQLSLLP